LSQFCLLRAFSFALISFAAPDSISQREAAQHNKQQRKATQQSRSIVFHNSSLKSDGQKDAMQKGSVFYVFLCNTNSIKKALVHRTPIFLFPNHRRKKTPITSESFQFFLFTTPYPMLKWFQLPK